MIFIWECLNYSFFKIRLGIVRSLYVSLYCLIQVDIKIIVAYSSVVHINFIISSLFSLMKIEVLRRVIVIVSHGLCSLISAFQAHSKRSTYRIKQDNFLATFKTIVFIFPRFFHAFTVPFLYKFREYVPSCDRNNRSIHHSSHWERRVGSKNSGNASN